MRFSKKSIAAYVLSAILVIAVTFLLDTKRSDATTTTTSTSTSTTLAQTDATMTWAIVGTIYDLPGSPPAVPFSCSTTGSTATAQFCEVKVGSLNVTFNAATTNFGVTFVATKVCGATASTCAPLFNSNDSVTKRTAATLQSTCSYTASDSALAYFPCTGCFGGARPAFRIVWAATSSSAAGGATSGC